MSSTQEDIASLKNLATASVLAGQQAGMVGENGSVELSVSARQQILGAINTLNNIPGENMSSQALASLLFGGKPKDVPPLTMGGLPQTQMLEIILSLKHAVAKLESLLSQ